MTERKEEGSSKTSMIGSAPIVDRKVEKSGQGVEEGVIGEPEIAQNAMIIAAGESGSCSEKTDDTSFVLRGAFTLLMIFADYSLIFLTSIGLSGKKTLCSM